MPLIIDEIQKAPELLPEIKILIDKQKFYWNSNNLPYELMFILTSSNQFDLQQDVSESLAGRTAILNLASLSYNEIRKSNNHNAFNPNINVLKQKEKNLNHLIELEKKYLMIYLKVECLNILLIIKIEIYSFLHILKLT